MPNWLVICLTILGALVVAMLFSEWMVGRQRR